jgi:hypothetical protein
MAQEPKKPGVFGNKLGSFRKNVVASPLLLWRLSKAHAWSATVLVDELNPCSFKSPADREIVSYRHGSLAIC